MKNIFCFLWVIACLVAVESWAQNENGDRARTRNYDGGIDEQPIQVQSVILGSKVDASTVKLQKQVLGVDSEESSTSDDSSDE